MKNKKTLLLIISALILSMTGCGDGMTPQEREEADRQTGAAELVGIPIDGAQGQPGETGEQNPENTELEQQIRELERRYGTPDFSQVEYLTLAELYNENNQVKKQRDTLEICFALYQDSAAEEQLQQLTVNASEEEPGVQGQMTLLEQNLSTQGYIDEAVSMLHGEEWRDTMMPRLNQGTRGYYQEQGDNSLYVRTGYDASGAFYTQVQYRQGEQVTVLLQTDVSVQLLETRLKEGQYDGVYECWTVLAASGDVIRENGNLRDGVLVGDYTAQIRWGKGENELLPLWNLREDMEMTTYNGNFGEDGISTAAQLSEAGDAIVYAYDSGKQNYLFFSGQETTAADSYVFRAESMGMPAPRVYAAYEPKADQSGVSPSGTIDIAQLQVRVFGGNIQVFDGTGWIDMGAAEDYIAADPVTLSSQAAEGGNAAGSENVGQGITAVYARRGGGQVTPVAMPTATPKPTSKPTAPA
ncbi:MAG: hypothetical protein K2I21_02585, partial [Acetatifactor sp.]|nr:hypothetical protein [Acetatifactor sp.]